MAVTLSHIPLIALARDPLPITFTTDNFKTSNAAKATCLLEIVTNPAVGYSFDVIFNNQTITFSVVTTPDDSGTQMRTINGGETLNDWVENVLVVILNKNKAVSEVFNVQYGISGPKHADFESLIAESISDLDIDVSGFLNANKVISSTGADAIFRTNFKINYQLVYYDTNLPFTNVESLEPDADEAVTIDISELLEGIAENNFVFEATEAWEILPNDIVKYYIKYWESYGIGDAFTNRAVNTTPLRRVIEGATSWIEQAKLNETDEFWWDAQLKNPWLTKKPTVSNILPDQKILLKFVQYFNGNEGTGINYNLVIKAFDANNDATTITINIGIIDQYDIVQIDASPQRHNIATDIVRIEVSIQSSYQQSILTPIYTFKLDRSYRNNIRYYFFRNSFGGYDTLQGLGITEAEENYKRQRATTQLPTNFTRKNRETRVVSVDNQVSFNANLGFMNNWGDGVNAWANYIRELYATDEGYEIIQGVYYPIDVLTTNQKLLEDENYIPEFLELEYSRAYVEKGAASQIYALEGSYTNQYTEPYD